MNHTLNGWFFVKGSLAHMVGTMMGKNSLKKSVFKNIEDEYSEIVAWCGGSEEIVDIGSMCIPYWNVTKGKQFSAGTVTWIPAVEHFERHIADLQGQIDALTEAQAAAGLEAPNSLDDDEKMVPTEPSGPPPKTIFADGQRGERHQLYTGKYADNKEGIIVVILKGCKRIDRGSMQGINH